jgi:hypothetical protein
VVWGSLSQDGDHFGVFGQRYDGAGNAAGGEFQVNTYTTSAQYEPGVASDSSGRFVVVWASFGQDGDRARRHWAPLRQHGQRREWRVPESTRIQPPPKWEPAIACDSAGNCIVVWIEQRPERAGRGRLGRIRPALRQRRNRSRYGISDHTYTTKFQSNAAVALDPNGSFVVAWDSNTEFDAPEDAQDGDRAGVFAQRYLADGSAAGSEFQVNAYTTGSQSNPAVSVDGTGGFIRPLD